MSSGFECRWLFIPMGGAIGLGQAINGLLPAHTVEIDASRFAYIFPQLVHHVSIARFRSNGALPSALQSRGCSWSRRWWFLREIRFMFNLARHMVSPVQSSE